MSEAIQKYFIANNKLRRMPGAREEIPYYYCKTSGRRVFFSRTFGKRYRSINTFHISSHASIKSTRIICWWCQYVRSEIDELERIMENNKHRRREYYSQH